MKILISGLLIIATATYSTVAQDKQITLQQFAQGNNQFTADVYRGLAEETEDNFIVSPFSTELVLALAQSGAKGKTGDEIRQVLHFPTGVARTEDTFRQLLNEFKKGEGYTLHAANKIYTTQNLELKKGFNYHAEKNYDAEVESLNFRDNVNAARSINQWVEDKTNSKIKDLVDPAKLQDLQMLLINALYFQGNFTRAFEGYSGPREFHSGGSVKNVTTMYKTSIYNYYESTALDAKYLEITFKNPDASLVIVLPNQKDGLRKLEQQIDKVYQEPKFEEELVKVNLPKFKIDSQITFTGLLAKLGLKTPFSSEADFSGISGEKGQMAISAVVQKAFIDVNENGVEAAAATYAGFVLLSGQSFLDEPKLFLADHPFLFYIKVKNVVLFTGRVAKL